ncbi:MAG: hypothetical protein JNG88_16175 [Phycisphaerales bacterium]|nr:hypothetical protein [Phycisphaerales bacterium]
MARTAPYTPTLISTAAASSLSGGTHAGGGKYENGALTGATSPTKGEYGIQQARLMQDRLWFIANPFVESVGGLNVGVTEVRYRKADGTRVKFTGSASFAMTDNTSNQYLYIETATNTLAKNTAWPGTESDYVPLAEIDTASGAVTEIRPALGDLMLRLPPTIGTLTGVDGTSITIDQDNAGAGVDQQVRFNRGSTDAEDAAILWDEANDRFVLVTQHTTLTAAPLKVAALIIGATTVLNSSGKLAAAAIDTSALYVFGANGATAVGAKLTAAGSSGAPSSGAHTKGELHIDSGGVLYVCTADGSPGTWYRAANQTTSVYVVSIGDATSGSSPVNCTLQVKDLAGANVAQVEYIEVSVNQDSDGAADATDATIDNSPVTGTFVRWVTSGKRGIYKTDASGTLTLDVAFTTPGSCYVLARAAARSRCLDCSDIGIVTKS